MTKTISATLSIEVDIFCPNKECGIYINLLNEDDTNGTAHDEDGALLKQVFHEQHKHKIFQCNEVVCTRCKTKFNVKGLE